MVLGITGISGAGKHTAADFFRQRGWVILDTDRIAHYLYRPYTHVWKAIVEHFGESILNQNDTINRKKLGKIVFDVQHSEKAAQDLKKLNQITHPSTKRHIKNEIHRHFRRKSNIVVVAALWKEIDLPNICEKILLINADLELACQRIQKRDGISEDTYYLRIKKQSVPPKPDFVVENNGGVEEFYKKLNELHLI